MCEPSGSDGAAAERIRWLSKVLPGFLLGRLLSILNLLQGRLPLSLRPCEQLRGGSWRDIPTKQDQHTCFK